MTDEALYRKQVAETILHQLGGSIFTLMTGCKDFVAVDGGLQFTVGEGAKYDVNKIRIILTPSDTYDVSAMTIDKYSDEVHEKCAISGIYNDQLQDAFYSCTGFFCTMSHSNTAVDFFLHETDLLLDSPNMASPEPDPLDSLAQVNESSKIKKLSAH